MADTCDTESGFAWGYCMALSAGERSRDAVLGTASGIAGGAQSVFGAGVEGAQDLTGGAIEGAQKTAQKLADAVKDAGPDIKLDAGAVAAIAALSVGGLLLADTWFTGGQGARSIARMFGKGR